MKRCINNHENPDEANYCRVCGYHFSTISDNHNKYFRKIINYLANFFIAIFNKLKRIYISYYTSNNQKNKTFTLDKFPNINLNPSSVVTLNFDIKKGIVRFVCMLALFILFAVYKEEIFNLMNSFRVSYNITFYTLQIILAIFCISFIVLTAPIVKRIIKKARYKYNADYIESYAFVRNIHRIAKNGKLGLFDKSTLSVIISTKYDSITQFDKEHLLIESNSKKGVFSIKKMSFIIPIKYEKIEPFRNSIAKCLINSDCIYYDVNGNQMK